MSVWIWALAGAVVIAVAAMASSRSSDTGPGQPGQKPPPGASARDEDGGRGGMAAGLSHAVVEAIDEGAVVVGEDDRVLLANQTARALLRHPVEAGQEVPAVFRPVLDALDEEEQEARSVQHITRDERIHVVRLTASRLADAPTTDPNRVGTGTRLIRILDVTDREDPSEALRSKHGLLEAIMDTSVAAVAVVNAQGQIVYANERAQEVLSLERTGPSRWTYRHLDWTVTRLGTTRSGDVQDAEDAENVEAALPGPKDGGEGFPLQQVLETGEPVRDLRCRIRWPDDTEKFVSIHAAPLGGPDGRPSQVVFSVADITQRIRAKRRLQREKRFSEAAINSLPGIFYMVDRDGRNRRWNRHFEEVTGYTHDELEGRQLSELFESSTSNVSSDISSVFRTGQFSIEANVVTKDGERIPHVFTGTAVEIEGTPYLVGVGLDISEQQERERELRAAKETAEAARAEADAARAEAEKMNRLKTAFLANMSHEIRTPLTGIIGSADVLREELSDEKQHLVRHIATGAYRLKDTLDAVLEISKLEAEARSLHLRTVDVVQEIHKTVDVLRSTATEAGVELRLFVEPDAWQMQVDPSAFGTIVTNLVHNAIKFTPSGGTVTVDVPDPEVEGRFLLRVIDTGIGIKASFLDEIFEPFTQESVGANREKGGSGLGLAITRHLVELMDGDITVHSEKGEGSTFELYLPSRVPSLPER